MIKKLAKKNLIPVAVCLAVIAVVAITVGMSLKKAPLGNSQISDTATEMIADNELVSNMAGEASADSSADEPAAVDAEPEVQIAMIEDGVFRGTGISNDNAIETVEISSDNMAENEASTGSLDITGVENPEALAEQETAELAVDSLEAIEPEAADDENTIVMLSFDEETIVKRIDGYEEKPEIKEEPKKEKEITLTGMSQSNDVAKKSKELVCKYNPKMDITLSDEEYEILCRIVEAEAGDQDIYGRILVANVILNRTQYWEFPDTVKGVVFQVNSKGAVQFSPISDGSFYRVKISKKTKKAVNSALSGDDYSDGALYFFMRSATSTSKASWFDSLEFVLKYGCHEFFK